MYYISEVLCEAEYLSLDPNDKLMMEKMPVGTTMVGNQIAK